MMYDMNPKKHLKVKTSTSKYSYWDDDKKFELVNVAEVEKHPKHFLTTPKIQD